MTALPTPGTLCAFVTHTDRVSVSGFGEVERALKASVTSGTRLYHEISGGPGSGMIFLVDVEIHRVRGSEVSHTIYTFRDEGLSPVTMEEILARFGSTPIKSTYNAVSECQLLTRLRDLNAGRPSSILRVLGVKDEALDEFYYVTNREEVMALFEDIKPMTTEPGTRISVLCSAPEHHYRARSQGFYSPKSELAPFIEAELAKQGIVFEK